MKSIICGLTIIAIIGSVILTLAAVSLADTPESPIAPTSLEECEALEERWNPVIEEAKPIETARLKSQRESAVRLCRE